MPNLSNADSPRSRAPWWFTLAGQLLQSWVRIRRDPAEPATWLQAGVPVCYVIERDGFSDALILQRACREAGLPSPMQPLAGTQDAFVATAAVADWRPATLSAQKIKKDGKKVAPTFELTENPDILAAVAALPRPPYCVGFAAESENLLAHAKAKLERKRLPLIVGNLGPSTFGRDDNQLLLVDAQGHRTLPESGQTADKLTLARALMLELAARLPAQP